MIVKPELLAPAGNIESFYGVLNAGADAVYMAGSRFGARAYADNFTDEELVSCIRYAHLYNKKIYLTVNTLVKNEEFDDLISFLLPLYKAGLDGVIVQDLGVLKLLNSTFPDLPLHASTQLSVTGKGASAFLQIIGVCRIVPARELDLEEIAEIKSSGVEVECFIHGAMCYCYSGQCLFSSVLGGRSGNRGRCAQPCRLPYSFEGSGQVYPLSLKDMQTIDILPELIEAGIDSFKIEGRMKKPEYAAGVTAIYRKYIDEYFEKGSVNISSKDRNILKSLYIRSEVLNGYYHKYNGADMISINSPAYSGTDESILDSIREKYLGSDAKIKLSKIPVRIDASFIEGEDAAITVSTGDIYVSVSGNKVDTANSRPVSHDDIDKQLRKLGNTVFKVVEDEENPGIYTSDNPFYPLKEINELRRRAIHELENEIIRGYGFNTDRDLVDNILNICDHVDVKNGDRRCKENGEVFSVSVNDVSQLKAVLDIDIPGLKRIYITEKMYCCDKEISQIITSCEYDIFVSLPYIRRKRTAYLREYIVRALKDGSVKGVLARNLEDLWFFNEVKKEIPGIWIHGDDCLYAWNIHTFDALEQYLDRITLPLELAAGAHKELIRKYQPFVFEKKIYGRYPLMQTANCVFKTNMNCKNKQPEKIHWTHLKDRTGRDIPVMADCLHCHNTIYNTVPLSVYKIKDYINEDNLVFRIDFTDEDPVVCKTILDYYTDLREGKITEHPGWEYTTGFEKKSTE